MEKKTTKVKEVEQPIEIEQSANFSSTLVEGGFFNIEVESPKILVDRPSPNI